MSALLNQNSPRRARLTMAEDAVQRQAELIKQNATAKQLARNSEIEVEIARAIVGRKEGELAKAQLALSRTRPPHELGRVVAKSLGPLRP